MTKFILSLLLASSSPSFAEEVEDAPAPAATPAEGRDSHWRHMVLLGAGTLSMRGNGAANVLSRDYKSGSGAQIGLIENYRPNTNWGIEFGLKLMGFTRKSKTSKLDLSLTYLALPFEVRYKIIPMFKRSGIYLKGGLTYLLLLTASVEDRSSGSSGSGDGHDWDWDDAYPSPPTKGSYRGSFNKTDILASLGAGADFLLFQVRDSFNMSLLPELMYYRGLTTISKSGEFGGRVYNEGYLVNLNVAFGF